MALNRAVRGLVEVFPDEVDFAGLLAQIGGVLVFKAQPQNPRRLRRGFREAFDFKDKIL